MSYLEELLPELRKGAKIKVASWEKHFYLQIKDGFVVDQSGEKYNLNLTDFNCRSWGLYQEPIDWDYIIKNKCLCWFWDIVEEAKIVGILCKINDDSGHKFVRNFEDAKIAYKHCRPVRRDEVTFYEDRKDD